MSASEFWNTRYQTDDYIFGTEANDFIKAVTSKQRPVRLPMHLLTVRDETVSIWPLSVIRLPQ